MTTPAELVDQVRSSIDELRRADVPRVALVELGDSGPFRGDESEPPQV